MVTRLPQTHSAEALLPEPQGTEMTEALPAHWGTTAVEPSDRKRKPLPSVRPSETFLEWRSKYLFSI